jgi:hypothetical protein
MNKEVEREAQPGRIQLATYVIDGHVFTGMFHREHSS